MGTTGGERERVFWNIVSGYDSAIVDCFSLLVCVCVCVLPQQFKHQSPRATATQVTKIAAMMRFVIAASLLFEHWQGNVIKDCQKHVLSHNDLSQNHCSSYFRKKRKEKKGGDLICSRLLETDIHK